ncbi:MAG: lysophospholipase [Gammaproteobacteria bacterium]|nr:lysophospholipase [Gammaproteobacteria bacterium]
MKIFLSIILLLFFAYLLLVAGMFIFQRSLLFFPVPYQEGIDRGEITFSNQGVKLQGWILNPGQSRAMIYFGGNSEAIEDNIYNFETIFSDYSIYLIHYRGYGKSEGKPGEAALFSDSIAIYDQIRSQYQSVSLLGRSLGSGVAVYLASKREVEKLILLTPYDSIAEVAQHHYPIVPVRLLSRDRFESYLYAPEVTAPVLIVTAEHDRVVPAAHGLKLRGYFTNTKVIYRMIELAAHNDITNFTEYQQLLGEFIGN